MIWTKDSIVKALKKLHKQGVDLSYNRLAKKQQSLVSASAYHFGSYRSAIERAGIDYAEVSRRPRWSKQTIITQIKKGFRDGEDLNWSSITKRRDELGKAAFASLQKRLFGSWDRALHAAGLDADDINRYRKWDKNSVVFDLKARSQSGEALNSGALQTEDPGLHAAAVRHFGDYEKALRAAKVNPDKIRQRRNWTKEEVLAALKAVKRTSAGKPVSDAIIRKSHSALYGACVRLFGSFTSARDAAGLGTKKVTKGKKSKK